MKRRCYRVAIIGGSGYVGSSLAKHLSRLFHVIVLDRRPLRDFDGDLRICDIRNQKTLVENLRGADLVINTAIVQIPRINEDKRLGYEVNVLGVQNICEAVEKVKSVKGLVHTSSWHVFGERDFKGRLDEKYGFHPDKVEPRARLYALCKIAQETIVRIMCDMSQKSYSIIRLGTVLGEQMPKQTAANIFIENALRQEPITPFSHTKGRPMLYVDILDVCKAFETSAITILRTQASKPNLRPMIVNLVSPPPVTILEMARIVRSVVVRLTAGKISPPIKIIESGVNSSYTFGDKRSLVADTSRAREMLGARNLIPCKQSIERIVFKKLKEREFTPNEKDGSLTQAKPI